ncbi:sensor histidine kinase [Paenibacillus pinihumi]|uniref:sensor histidine kinase n=1 Tax=Paenibacillus pinihumi TaxID=669462 RepID=UPI00041400FD|nr:HAMP domain-containing sensor histidine kinase [Paenibacillus pinihumi]
MDTKSKKNNWLSRISPDYQVILGALLLGFIVLALRIYNILWMSMLTFESIITILVVVILLILAGKIYYQVTPGTGKHNSVVPIYLQLLRRYLSVWQTFFINGQMTFKFVTLFVLTAIAGTCIWIMVNNPYSYELVVPYLVLYLFIVIPYLLNKLRQLIEIVRSTREIAQGNIQSAISVQGKGTLPKLAGYINNMKSGYQDALENQMKSERLKTELVSNVSHDLKTPLTSIINYVDLLKKEELPSDKTRSYVEILDRKALRLKALIEDLFEVSKMTSGTVELDIQYVDVATLLTQAIAEVSSNFGDESVAVREKIANPHIYAHLDGNRIWRVFENLIGNAKKYALPGTRIYIYLDESESDVHFKIQNTSSYEIDFAADELFERFKRADESRHTEGSGLGLAIVKSIVELHGGNISIEVNGDQFNVKLDLPKTRL